MTASADPAAVLSPLPRADGSATYSCSGFTITGSVNGPMEAQRRDEDPYRAIIDVVVRPAAGVGGTSERHLESILRSSLEQLILAQNFPRSLIQIVLQVQTSPENEYANAKLIQARLNPAVIPALLQTAVLACLSASIPLRATATAAVVSVVREPAGTRALVTDPSARDVDCAASTHVFAFTSQEELILTESEGDFTLNEWQKACAAAQRICARQTTGSDMAMDDEGSADPDMSHFLRASLEAKVASDLRWK